MTPNKYDATDSVLGFLYQGQYALLLLWSAGEDDAVSVETQDDVVLEGTDVTLHQLKHSQGTPPDLRITNAGVWRTLRIWVDHLRAEDRSAPEVLSEGRGTRFCFVTVAAVAIDDPLSLVREGATRTPNSDSVVVAALTAEAERVEAARAAARASGDPEPHGDRARGCATFLALPPQSRALLVRRMTILDGQIRITDVADRVAGLLKDYVRKEHRNSVTDRLISWWDRQVALALMSKRPRRIAKAELTGAIHDFISEQRSTTLPDLFSLRRPDDEDLTAERGGNIERQIKWVRGGDSRVVLALVARWRARAQRRAWTEYDVSITSDLNEFDDRLREAWAERHGPLRDDCIGLPEDEVCSRGLGLLEWAFFTAPQQVPPPRPEWNRPFYAQGMLQQFADDLEVGWHPEYLSLLASDSEELRAEAARADGPRHSVRSARGPEKTVRPNSGSSGRTGRGRKKSTNSGDET